MIPCIITSNIAYDISSRDFHIIASRAAYSVLTNPIIRLPSQTPFFPIILQIVPTIITNLVSRTVRASLM